MTGISTKQEELDHDYWEAYFKSSNTLIAEGDAKKLGDLLIAADSELTAIAHGRPASDAQELKDISYSMRTIWEKYFKPA